jgi:hypothetical protein
VRNDADLERIREYIEGNPAKWGEDPENPAPVPGTAHDWLADRLRAH